MKFLTSLLVTLSVVNHAAASTCNENGLEGKLLHFGSSTPIFDESADALKSDEHAYFIPEVFCRAVPESDVSVLMSEQILDGDGKYSFLDSIDGKGGSLPAGQYNSFLIHGLKASDAISVFEFEVTFCEPIVALITSNENNELFDSDKLFGMGDATYGALLSHRLFEFNRGAETNWVKISEDRLTMNVSMRIVNKIDDLRVITACESDGCSRRLEESSISIGDQRMLEEATCPDPITNKNSEVDYDDDMLAKKWGITDPTFDYQSMSFALCYGVSNMIEADMAQYQVFAGDCETPLDDPDSLRITDSLTGDDLGTGDGDREHGLKIAVGTDNIQQSNIYLNEADGNGKIEFCIRNQLFITALNKEVNYLETIVTLTVKLRDCFSIDSIAVAPNEKDQQQATDKYELEGYLCADDDEELDTENQSYSQGDVIRVCVRPDAEARPNNLYMRSIDSLTFTLQGDTSVTQPAVVGPNEASNLGLSTVECNSGDQICAVNTILFARFFASQDKVNANGNAVLQFGTTPIAEDRRSLKSGRNLQEDQAEASAKKFDVAASVTMADDEFRSGSGSNPTQAVTFLGCLLAGFAVFF